MKKILFVFGAAFFSNLIWENLHAYLYSYYMHGPITEYILLRASFWDAVIILAISIPFLYIRIFQKNEWGIVVFGLIIAIGIEEYALATGRWSYNVYMPLIPFLHIGLTPTVQLGLLGYFIFQLQKKSSFFR